MNAEQTATAQRCLDAAYDGALDFPAIVGILMNAGFEGYDVDYRQGTATYFCANGEHVQLLLPPSKATVGIEFRAQDIERAVREAQNQVPGYSYGGFCATVKAAGCAGYMVSFLGRRVLYFGRTAEIHVEHFPR